MTVISIKTGNVSIQINDSDIVITMGDAAKCSHHLNHFPAEKKHELVYGLEPKFTPIEESPLPSFESAMEEMAFKDVPKNMPGDLTDRGFLPRKELGQGKCSSCGRTFEKKRKDQRKCCLPDCYLVTKKREKAEEKKEDPDGEEI